MEDCCLVLLRRGYPQIFSISTPPENHLAREFSFHEASKTLSQFQLTLCTQSDTYHLSRANLASTTLVLF